MQRGAERITDPVPALRVVSDEHPCCYIPGRIARHEYLFAHHVGADDYVRLMDLNYRRGGVTIYRPICRGCQACRQLRVPVSDFRPNRTQRRAVRRNADLTLRVGEPRLTLDRWDLYNRYQAYRHAEDGEDSPETLESFLYSTCVPTLEWSWYLGEQLVMVGIADVSSRALSAVYCFYEPRMSGRSLGTFNILSMIRLAGEDGLDYVYLGFYVEGASKMLYKRNFRPCEVLDASGRWTTCD
jgi:arginine-tRNA-protein transferase